MNLVDNEFNLCSVLSTDWAYMNFIQTNMYFKLLLDISYMCTFGMLHGLPTVSHMQSIHDHRTDREPN